MKIYPGLTLLVIVFILSVPLFPQGATATQPPETNRMEKDQAPTPFSAAEIRDACPRDRKIVFQVEMFGNPIIYRTTKFASHHDDYTVLENITTGTDGKKIGKTQLVTAKWLDLQAHASFPADQTRISSESYSVPAGTFDCWLYVIKITQGGKTTAKRLWFAKKLPGPPICYEEQVDGKTTYRMIMLKNTQ